MRLPLVLVSLLAAWLPSALSAQDDADARARVHFDSARVHFDEGQYEAARDEFQAAFELSHRDGLLYNLYLCEERLAHVAEAATFLERFLATSGVPEAERPTLERRLVNLRARLAESAPPVEAPATAPITPAVSVDATPRADDRGTLVAAGIGTLAAGGAGLIAAAILGGLAAAEDARVGARCGASAGRVCTDAELRTLGDLSVAADVSLTVGLVLAAGGAALWLAGELSGGPDATQALVVPADHGALLVVRGAL